MPRTEGTHRDEPLFDRGRVDLVPVLMVRLALVHEVPENGRAAAEPGHLPAEGHGLAVTVQERHPVRERGDGYKEAQRRGGHISAGPLWVPPAAATLATGAGPEHGAPSHFPGLPFTHLFHAVF